MCIIIQKEPEFKIPKDKFLNCVVNNPDGWGISASDGSGVLTTIRSVDGETEAEELYDLIHGEFDKDKVLIHLRYNTAGETCLRNAHPFPILEFDTDGVDLRMAHNGTIHKYKRGAKDQRSWESDTRNFVANYVRPLFKRMAAGVGPSELLKDSFIEKILEDQIPTASVLSFLDGYGNSLNVNAEGNGGEQEEGWYYSNVYSFNPKHRLPVATTVTGKTTTVGTRRTQTSNTGEGYTSQTQYWKNKAPKPSGSSSSKGNYYQKDASVVPFSTKFDVQDPFDLTLLTDEALDLMLEDSPEDLLSLVKETLCIIYKQGKKNMKLEKENLGLRQSLKGVKDKGNKNAA